MLGRVTTIAGEARVLALQCVSSLLVVEYLGIPLNQGKIFAIVFRMTADTLLTRTRRKMIGSMQALAFGQALGNFRVAIQALEGCLSSSQLVAAAAIGGSVKRLVSSRQRSRRNLPDTKWPQEKQAGSAEEKPQHLAQQRSRGLFTTPAF